MYILASIFFTSFFDCEAARKISKPKFGKLSGNVHVGGKPAKQHHYISPDTEIEAVGKDSYFEIKFNNGSLVRVVNGKIILKGGKKNKVSGINLLRGKFYGDIKKHGRRSSFR
ncbi:MAG: hypothetical protein OXB84_01355, partial [Halobacteriovoraceae bacterium]|nr:hypothetical protein [Halobacteriovoraceae bacterium]